jgi:hypothetical protein
MRRREFIAGLGCLAAMLAIRSDASAADSFVGFRGALADAQVMGALDAHLAAYLVTAA